MRGAELGAASYCGKPSCVAGAPGHQIALSRRLAPTTASCGLAGDRGARIEQLFPGLAELGSARNNRFGDCEGCVWMLRAELAECLEERRHISLEQPLQRRQRGGRIAGFGGRHQPAPSCETDCVFAEPLCCRRRESVLACE